jgi:hypothetical protein
MIQDTRGALINRVLYSLPTELCTLIIKFCDTAWRQLMYTNEDYTDLDENELATVISQTQCTLFAAQRALRHQGNIIDAILYLMP